jgi:hypothetical protein
LKNGFKNSGWCDSSCTLSTALALSSAVRRRGRIVFVIRPVILAGDRRCQGSRFDFSPFNFMPKNCRWCWGKICESPWYVFFLTGKNGSLAVYSDSASLANYCPIRKTTPWYEKRVFRINPSLLLKINLQNTSTLQLININQMKLFTKDNWGASLIKRGLWQKCCALGLIKLKDVFHF